MQNKAEEVAVRQSFRRLDEARKKSEIKNILQQFKNKGIIHPEGKVWKMSKPGW
jgi:predicted metalloprotease